MNKTCLADPDWYRALTLAERIATLHVSGHHLPDAEVDTDVAEQRLRYWESQKPFTDDAYLAERLKSDGISEDEFRYILGEPVERLKDRVQIPPTWLDELAEALSRPALFDSRRDGKPDDGQEPPGFLEVLQPLIQRARSRVRREVQVRIRSQPTLPFDPTTIDEVLYTNLPGRLRAMLSRTLVLELHVARLQGLLQGETPEERFYSFVERLRQRDTALAILQEYPVLARQLVLRIDQWARFSLEFLNRLCADWEAIKQTFSPHADPGMLEQLSITGDRHRDGRAVLIARFSSGFQLVYKPKSLEVDNHLQELLTWLNLRGAYPSFRTVKILPRENYGWVEFVATQNCTSVEEIRRFYQRQGGYLALLYVLQATDFHHENLIAVGEHPVLVDVESLFHPRLRSRDAKQSELFAGSAMVDSVLRIGLLPRRIWANDDSDGVDISGLGMLPGQISPRGVPHWEGVGTDEIRFSRQRVPLPEGKNRPTLNGGTINVLDYADDILAGFTRMYELLLHYRDPLLADDGPLMRFADDEVRAVLRPTRTYALLLQESFHPDVLRDALDRDCLFDRLWVGVEHRPYVAKVIPAEREDLWRNDIPIFTTRPTSRHLWTSTGECLADFFDESGIDLVRQRIQRLDEEDMRRQLWFIHASLTTLALAEDHAPKPRYRLAEPRTSADRKRLLAAAQAVGDHLGALALRGEDDAIWLGITLINQRYWSVLPLGMDLYNGLSGIALFLAYLGRITQEDRYTRLAHAAATTLRRQIEQDEQTRSVGGFSGWGGVVYALTHLAVLWDQPELLTEAERIAERLPELIEQDEVLDVIAGSAGCIGGLLSLYRFLPSEQTLAVAVQCADRLIERAQPMSQGVGWMPHARVGTRPLAGFSHGAAGMAWALLELHAITDEERYRTTAVEAIAYERSLFLPEAGNWPDLREFEGRDQPTTNGRELPQFMTAWCHGAPGIGIARLRALQHLDDPEIRTEIDVALQTTLAQGFGRNHSLCHGDLGNLELLLQASLTLDAPRWGGHVNRLTAMILESIEEHGWLCGVPLGVETPGLMTGLAGIGYGLLRLAAPERVPSVLLMEPPKLPQTATTPASIQAPSVVPGGIA